MADDTDILVEVKGVSKKFSHTLKQSMRYGLQDLAKSIFGFSNTSSALREGEFWAVKDIDFTLRRGECLGLIGHNGAGKSTLLKMLNGLIRPDEGSITMRGKVGALIELGAGFNPLLTGRENIYVNGQLLGFTKKEIDGKLEAILDFAEIGEFIDSPVQNYSSGMKVRLGFAVASQMEPDILLIDEVLAVGDIGFRVKCLNRISELLHTCAVIFVSHTMTQVTRICTYGILLNKGKIKLSTNDFGKLITEYFGMINIENESEIGSGKAQINNIIINGASDFINDQYVISKNFINISASICVNSKVNQYAVHFVFNDQESRPIAMLSSITHGILFENQSTTKNINVDLPTIFSDGSYTLHITIVEILNENRIGETLISKRNCIKFIVKNNSYPTAIPIQINGIWIIN